MRIKVKGEMTIAELKQALFEKLGLSGFPNDFFR